MLLSSDTNALQFKRRAEKKNETELGEAGGGCADCNLSVTLCMNLVDIYATCWIVDTTFRNVKFSNLIEASLPPCRVQLCA